MLRVMTATTTKTATPLAVEEEDEDEEEEKKKEEEEEEKKQDEETNPVATRGDAVRRAPALRCSPKCRAYDGAHCAAPNAPSAASSTAHRELVRACVPTVDGGEPAGACACGSAAEGNFNALVLEGVRGSLPRAL